ncbi:hypothetical protein EDD90_2757 [Streptomyces sp. Ag109_O5-1]|uniref:hypothetical protein n=1 Tax=Streptomyces sp. Ag109_O5-1 TaxID=1938851 RepID=UPI000F4F29E3|nr:hypothetical protein [Streptomyces sp. Ag109_O5-1]RPE39740.1 hypothetical protein EDD90_2757 [Streptomyces sp. Ag109_O5-1]
MSVFHRVDDIHRLDAPSFFKLAWRLPAYQGVLHHHVMQQTAEQNQQSPGPQAGSTSYSAPSPGRDVNPGTQATLQADPAFQAIISFG